MSACFIYIIKNRKKNYWYLKGHGSYKSMARCFGLEKAWFRAPPSADKITYLTSPYINIYLTNCEEETQTLENWLRRCPNA